MAYIAQHTDSIPKRITRKDIALLTGMLIIAMLELALYMTNGVSRRVPAEVNAFALTGEACDKRK